MPISSPRIPRLLAGALLLWAGCAAGSPAPDWGASLAGGPQSYSSDSLGARVASWDLEGRLRLRPAESLSLDLDLRSLSDLYDLRNSLGMDARWGTGALALRGGLDLSWREAGELSLPLLIFDPDSLVAREEEERGHHDRRLSLGLDWLGASMDAGLVLELGERRYEISDPLLSDRESDRLSARLMRFLPAELMLELEAVTEGERYRHREASDRRGWELGAALSRPLGEGWNLRLGLSALGQDVADASEISSYERPGGRGAQAEMLLDAFLARGEGSLRLSAEREVWDPYEGYYHDGWSRRAELWAGAELRSPLRLEGLLALEGFEPDSLPRSTWDEERGRERRWEAELALRLKPRGPWRGEVSLLGENTRITSLEEDEFRLLQLRLGLDWRPDDKRALRAEISLDEFQSDYEGEDSLRETGWGFALRAERRWRELTFGLDASRSRSYSFLTEEGGIEDWRLTLKLSRGMDPFTAR